MALKKRKERKMLRSKPVLLALMVCACVVLVQNPMVQAQEAAAAKAILRSSAGSPDNPESAPATMMDPRPRNPFAAPVTASLTIVEPNGTEKKEIVFDGSSLDPMMLDMQSVDWDHVPRIKVTGLMEVDGKIAVCAEVGGMGMTVLRENERILVCNGGRKQGPVNESPWFLVKKINKRNMTIQLDDGTVIQGKFF